MKKLLTIVTCLTMTALLQSQTVIFVTPTGIGDGTSWATACSLEKAVKNAVSGNEIWVQKGTYYPSKMLIVAPFVKIYGGFSGTETNLSQRNLAANPTIIDAQQKFGSIFRLENSAELDGFTIQNGNAQNNPHYNGGGVWADENTIIRYCTIVNNTAFANGGGIYAKGSLALLSTTIENNTATGDGADLYGNCVSYVTLPAVVEHPDVTAQTLMQGKNFTPLSVSATGTEPLSYQWYSNTTKSNVGGIPVGEDSPSFAPSTAVLGTLYYYCIVSNAHGKAVSNVSEAHQVVSAFEVLTIDYTGAPREVFLPAGTYTIECWGAQGGHASAKGGYTRGEITITKTTQMYVYVGGAGVALGASPNRLAQGGWNGGGCGHDGTSNTRFSKSSGGGASDVRLVYGAWTGNGSVDGWNTTAESLRSRIMVAGAGGTYSTATGGGLTGGGADYGASGGTQTAGGNYGNAGGGRIGGAGKFGIGGSPVAAPSIGRYGNGGGAGWYGGGSGCGPYATQSSGAGGSSFISGHTGCNAVNADGTHRGHATHYSGLVFTQTVMLSGNQSMPNPRGSGNITGNSGHGFVRITFLNE